MSWWDDNFLEFHDVFGKSASICKSNINVVSVPFYEAAFQAYTKLDELLVEIMHDNDSTLDISGVYILPQTIIMIDYHKLKKDSYYTLFVFLKSGEPMMYCIVADALGVDDGISWVTNKWVENKSDVIPMSIAQFHMASIIHMFKSFASIETKYLEPHSKIKDISCKYINETKLPITYLDSKWFTNLVKSDAFAVRGHFRLQPKKKDGKWTHELIYINDFMKTGYTAPARKLSLTPDL
jgi:hypothetical protein